MKKKDYIQFIRNIFQYQIHYLYSISKIFYIMSKIPTNNPTKFNLNQIFSIRQCLPQKELQATPVQQMIRLRKYCTGQMVKKYNSERQFYHLQLMNHILDISEQRQIQLQPQIKITAMDYKFDDQYEYMSKYFKATEIPIQMIELNSYYKYYLQYPIITGRQHFRTVFVYNQKKKQHNYKHLKKIIDSSYVVSSTGTSIVKEINNQQIRKQNQTYCTKELSNILQEISKSRINQIQKNQSICFKILRDQLISKFGNSQHSDMNQIDKKYHFVNKWIELKDLQKLAWIKKRRNQNIERKIPKKCRTLQSTSSTNQNICFFQSIKQYNNKNKDLSQKKILKQKVQIKRKKIQRLKTLYNEKAAKEYIQSFQTKINKIKGVIDKDMRILFKQRENINRMSYQNVEKIKFCTFSNQQPPNFKKMNKKIKNENLQKIYNAKADPRVRVRINRNNLKIKTNSCENIDKMVKSSKIEDYIEFYRSSINSIRKSNHNEHIQNINNRKQKQVHTYNQVAKSSIKQIYHKKSESQFKNKRKLRKKNSIEKIGNNIHKNYGQMN